MRPGRFLAGDLFGTHRLPDASLAAWIGDVTGKGVEAAVLMAAVQAHLVASLSAATDLAEAVGRVNRFVSAHAAPNRFVTLLVLILDPMTGHAWCVDAGHGLAMLRQNGETSRPRLGMGIPLGIDPDFSFTAERITLEPGDAALLYTDGLVEQTCLDGSEFGSDRVQRYLEGDHADGGLDDLLASVERLAGTSRWEDDVTVALIRHVREE